MMEYNQERSLWPWSSGCYFEEKEEVFLMESHEEEDMVFIERNGGVVLLRNGHQYTKIRTDNKSGAEIWRCVKWRKKCGATVTLKEGYVPSETSHICQPDHTANFIARTKYECKKKVMSSDVASIPQTYNKFIAEIKESNMDMMHHMPSFRSVKSAMYAIRGKQFGVKKRTKKSLQEGDMPDTEEHKLI